MSRESTRMEQAGEVTERWKRNGRSANFALRPDKPTRCWAGAYGWALGSGRQHDLFGSRRRHLCDACRSRCSGRTLCSAGPAGLRDGNRGCGYSLCRGWKPRAEQRRMDAVVGIYELNKLIERWLGI